MNAIEARKLAKDSQVKDQFATIIEIIFKEASKGKMECWIYNEAINDPTRDLLIIGGYTVGKPQFDRNETLTQIKW